MSQLARGPLQGLKGVSLWNDANFAALYIYVLCVFNVKPGTFNQAQWKNNKETQFGSNSVQVQSDKKDSGDNKVSKTNKSLGHLHATPCQDKSASVLSHWRWPSVCVRLFLDRKRNRKRVQSRTGRPASSLLQVQRWGDRKVLWHWRSGWAGGWGWGGETAVRKWATWAWFSNKWCTTPPGGVAGAGGWGFHSRQPLHLDLTYLTAAVWTLHKLLSGYEKLRVTTQRHCFVRQK